MAKSLRSKVKRAFRSKKRESGIYAATEAARLDRLNARLLQITKTDATHIEGKGEGDSGWCWFACLGLLGPNDVTLESLERFPPPPPRLLGELLWWFFKNINFSLTVGMLDVSKGQTGSFGRNNIVVGIYLSAVRINGGGDGITTPASIYAWASWVTQGRMAEIEGDAYQTRCKRHESPRRNCC